MENAEEHTEKELLLQIAQGNEKAFEQLFNRYHSHTHLVAYKLTHSEVAAEELVQDVFLKIWLRRTELQTVNDFKSFLFIMTRNQSYTTLKRILRQRQVLRQAFAEQTALDNSSDNLILEKDFERFLETAIQRLPPQQQQVYRLSRERGLNRDEMAELLNLSPNTIKTHLSQALRSIRAFCIANIDSPGMLAAYLYASVHISV